MILIEETSVPVASLPIQAFRDHLRLGTGFADDATQDVLLEALLMAAISAVEARTGKALLQRSFRWTLADWRDRYHQGLPVAPVQSITDIRIVDRDGNETLVSADDYLLMRDSSIPTIEARSVLPFVPSGSSVDVRFEAGFGPDWTDVPSDMAQAVLLLAAHYYENRSGDGTPWPQAVSALIASYRRLRLGASA